MDVSIPGFAGGQFGFDQREQNPQLGLQNWMQGMPVSFQLVLRRTFPQLFDQYQTDVTRAVDDPHNQYDLLGQGNYHNDGVNNEGAGVVRSTMTGPMGAFGNTQIPTWQDWLAKLNPYQIAHQQQQAQRADSIRNFQHSDLAGWGTQRQGVF